MNAVLFPFNYLYFLQCRYIFLRNFHFKKGQRHEETVGTEKTRLSPLTIWPRDICLLFWGPPLILRPFCPSIVLTKRRRGIGSLGRRLVGIPTMVWETEESEWFIVPFQERSQPIHLAHSCMCVCKKSKHQSELGADCLAIKGPSYILFVQSLGYFPIYW